MNLEVTRESEVSAYKIVLRYEANMGVAEKVEYSQPILAESERENMKNKNRHNR